MLLKRPHPAVRFFVAVLPALSLLALISTGCAKKEDPNEVPPPAANAKTVEPPKPGETMQGLAPAGGGGAPK
jgi:hypothetical protein